MPDPITISVLASLASVLSIAASVKDLMTRRGISKEEAIETYRKETTDEEERQLLDNPDIQGGILSIADVISEKLLKQLAEEATDCDEDHVNSRKEAKTQHDKRKAAIKASQCVCSVLQDIKLHNDNRLPNGEPFMSLWASYNCTD